MRRKNKNINRGALKRAARGTTFSLPHIENGVRVRVKGQAPLYPGAYAQVIDVLFEHGMTVCRLWMTATRTRIKIPLEHVEPV